MFEYLVTSKWAGWGGGFGSESDVAAIANREAANGWRLVRTEIGSFRWWWFVLRRKLLMVFERERRPDEGAI